MIIYDRGNPVAVAFVHPWKKLLPGSGFEPASLGLLTLYNTYDLHGLGSFYQGCNTKFCNYVKGSVCMDLRFVENVF